MILSLIFGNQTVGTNIDLVKQVAQGSPGKTLPVLVQRGSQRVRLSVTPGAWTDEKGEQHPNGFGFSYGSNSELPRPACPRRLAMASSIPGRCWAFHRALAS